ncbi:Zn-dependent hydrolase, partial [Pseudoalteromonas sp. S4389]
FSEQPGNSHESKTTSEKSAKENYPQVIYIVRNRLYIYTDFSLTSDLSHLSDNQIQMIGKLIDASKIMDELFWRQAFVENKDA